MDQIHGDIEFSVRAFIISVIMSSSFTIYCVTHGLTTSVSVWTGFWATIGTIMLAGSITSLYGCAKQVISDYKKEKERE